MPQKRLYTIRSVVKTYPSIDPLVPPPNIYAYKCQIISIACCDVMTSQHVSLILSDGDQNDLARQQTRVHDSV